MSSRTTPRASRAFSLVELMVALAVSSTVIIGAVSLLVGQQRAYRAGASDRGLQETARVALEEIGGSLRMAGFGVDPPLAFDFGAADNITMRQAPRIAGQTVKNSGFKCANPVACRDRIDRADEIVFYSRDPAFGHLITAVGGTTSITISGPLRVPLYAGQVLLAMCTTGNMLWAYVTVGAYVPASPNPAVVTLAGGAGLSFPLQNDALSDGCFGSGIAPVVKIDRYRYYVDTFDGAGNSLPAETPGSRPFLMLDQGLTDESGNAILQAIAPDVEDLQFEYMFPAGAVPRVGSTPNAVIAAGAAGIDLAPATGAPGYGTSVVDPSRANQHPANIRAVRVSLVARSADTDPAVRDQTVPVASNRPGLPGLPNYRRMLFETTIAVQNMDARAPYFPTYTSNGGADNLNIGGG